jgi:hypothetical protein
LFSLHPEPTLCSQPRLAAAATALASMDAETRYQDEVRECRVALDALCADASLTPADFSAALAALRQIFRNLAVQPPAARFRKLPLQNAAFHARVGRWATARAFLKAVGFREAGGQLFMLPAFEKPAHQV